jgi:hypothetical protein
MELGAAIAVIGAAVFTAGALIGLVVAWRRLHD